MNYKLKTSKLSHDYSPTIIAIYTSNFTTIDSRARSNGVKDSETDISVQDSNVYVLKL